MAKQRKDPSRTGNYENDPRWPKFKELYVEFNGNAQKAAIAAGFEPAWARSRAYVLAARLRMKAGPVLRRYGLDEVFVARKLKKLARAKAPKWNKSKIVKPAVMDPADPKKVLEPAVLGDWDYFEDGATQTRATEMIREMLEMIPPKTIKGDGPGGSVRVLLKSSIPRPTRPEVKE